MSKELQNAIRTLRAIRAKERKEYAGKIYPLLVKKYVGKYFQDTCGKGNIFYYKILHINKSTLDKDRKGNPEFSFNWLGVHFLGQSEKRIIIEDMNSGMLPLRACTKELFNEKYEEAQKYLNNAFKK